MKQTYQHSMNSGIKRREKLSKDEVCKIGKDIKKELC
jgi:hypothetical protein